MKIKVRKNIAAASPACPVCSPESVERRTERRACPVRCKQPTLVRMQGGWTSSPYLPQRKGCPRFFLVPPCANSPGDGNVLRHILYNFQFVRSKIRLSSYAVLNGATAFDQNARLYEWFGEVIKVVSCKQLPRPLTFPFIQWVARLFLRELLLGQQYINYARFCALRTIFPFIK